MLSSIEEKIFVAGIAENPYNQGIPNKPIYLDSIEEFVELDDRLIPNHVYALVKKGLVNSDDDYVWLTNKGVRFYNDLIQKCA
jgi:predicted transcriptional regulator